MASDGCNLQGDEGDWKTNVVLVHDADADAEEEEDDDEDDDDGCQHMLGESKGKDGKRELLECTGGSVATLCGGQSPSKQQGKPNHAFTGKN